MVVRKKTHSFHNDLPPIQKRIPLLLVILPKTFNSNFIKIRFYDFGDKIGMLQNGYLKGFETMESKLE